LGRRAAGFAFGALLALGGNVDLARLLKNGVIRRRNRKAFNTRLSKFVPERAPAPTRAAAFRRFLPRNFPRASAVLGKFEGSGVRSASPESRRDPRSAMSDQILLQFEAIRMIAASLVAVAIAIAWVLAVGK
jgi:hypothetical protein